MSLLLIAIVLLALGLIKFVTDKMGRGMQSTSIIE